MQVQPAGHPGKAGPMVTASVILSSKDHCMGLMKMLEGKMGSGSSETCMEIRQGIALTFLVPGQLEMKELYQVKKRAHRVCLGFRHFESLYSRY